MFLLADQAGAPGISDAGAFAPADGAAWTELEQISDGQDSSRTLLTEHARLIGAQGLLSLDATLSEQVIGSLGLTAARSADLWRATTTELDQPDAAQSVRVYDVGSEIRLVAESDPAITFLYDPPLVELPADPRPGSTWEGTGSAGGEFGYSASFAIAGTDSDCLQVSGDITYQIGPAALTRDVERTWCPAEGMVAASESTGDTQMQLSRISAPQNTLQVQEADPFTWSDPSQWQHAEFPAQSAHPQFGPGPIAGGPGALFPILTASGLLVQASISQDLVALAPDDGSPGTYSTLWRSHPGGSIMSIAAIGDLVVAGTTQRTLVGYGPDGLRLWTTDLPDVVMTRPVLTAAGHLVAVTIAGDVLALDPVSGTELWQTSLRTDISPVSHPVSEAERVFVMGNNGDLIALSADTGEELWHTEVPDGQRVAVLDSMVLVGAGPGGGGGAPRPGGGGGAGPVGPAPSPHRTANHCGWCRSMTTRRRWRSPADNCSSPPAVPPWPSPPTAPSAGLTREMSASSPTARWSPSWTGPAWMCSTPTAP